MGSSNDSQPVFRETHIFPLNPTAWIAACVGLLVLTLSAALYVQGARLDTCKAEAKADRLVIQSLGDKIADQNAAVEALDAAGKAAKAKGAAAVAKARKQALGLQGEVGRLDALLKQKPSIDRACSDGVRDAKSGLLR